MFAGRLIREVQTPDDDLTKDERDELVGVGYGAFLARVSKAFVDDFISFRRDSGRGESTISKNLKGFKSVLSMARREGLLMGDVTMLFPEEFGADYEPKGFSGHTSRPTRLWPYCSPIVEPSLCFAWLRERRPVRSREPQGSRSVTGSLDGSA
jgi:hypothetical protein